MSMLLDEARGAEFGAVVPIASIRATDASETIVRNRAGGWPTQGSRQQIDILMPQRHS